METQGTRCVPLRHLRGSQSSPDRTQLQLSASVLQDLLNLPTKLIFISLLCIFDIRFCLVMGPFPRDLVLAWFPTSTPNIIFAHFTTNHVLVAFPQVFFTPFSWQVSPLKANFTYFLCSDKHLNCFVQFLTTQSPRDLRSVLTEPCNNAALRRCFLIHAPQDHCTCLHKSTYLVAAVCLYFYMCLPQQDGNPSRAGTMLYAWHLQKPSVRRHLTHPSGT